jgi:5-(carboxyamino)imidazole ribonucleotide synthase
VKKISTLGIVGGGQLGRMICFYAHRLGLRSVIFTDQKNSPASFATNQTIIADYSDKTALKKFADLVDVASFEFENIPFETADFLASQVSFFPNPNILKITQHRILEKNFLNSIGIKTTDFAEISSLEDLQKNLKIFGKAILKTATMGYDGKGQFILSNVEEAKNIWPQVASQKLILEKFCPFDSEISVVVARSRSGQISCYEPLTNIHKNGILDESIYPAKIPNHLKIKAQEIARKIAQELDLIGILAVEFFVIRQNSLESEKASFGGWGSPQGGAAHESRKNKISEELLVNELAPRPHNSGHFSMDGAITSQFEQLILAITGLPLGSSEFHSSGSMKNLIGDEVFNLEKFYQNPRAKIHLYGKSEAKEGRKMGHVNILKT